MSNHSAEQIEQAALKVLRGAGYVSVQTNVDKIASSLDVRIDRDDLDRGVSVVLILGKSETVISVNRQLTENRRRHAIAHALGHLVLHAPDDPERKAYIDNHIPIYHQFGEGQARIEYEASLFGSALLMPQYRVVEKTQTLDIECEGVVSSMAKVFGVSDQLMVLRLQQLNIISPNLLIAA